MLSANLMKRLELFDSGAVMGQQSEEEGAQHASLGGPCVQFDGAGCVTADPYLPEVSQSESPKSQLHSNLLSPRWTNL